MEFDAARAYADVERLAFPRRTGGGGNERARAFIEQSLRDAGLNPKEERFRFSPLPMSLMLPAALLFVGGVFLAAALTSPHSPGLALAILFIGFLAVSPALRWSFGTERLLDVGRKEEGVNITASLADPEGADRHVLLMAHYDSKSQRLPIWLRAATAAAVVLGAGVVSALVLAGAFVGRAIAAPWVLGAGALCALGLVVLAANTSGDRSPGALDNAAGAALLLELARSVPHLRLRRTRVTLVATGAEEEGLVGSVRFFQAHQGDLGPNPRLINLDSPGGDGPVVLLSAFGIPPIATGRALAGLAERAAEEQGVPCRSLFLPVGVGTDHFPAAVRGIPAITLASAGRSLRRIHTPHDTPDQVTPAALAHAGRLAVALLRALDRGQG